MKLRSTLYSLLIVASLLASNVKADELDALLAPAIPSFDLSLFRAQQRVFDDVSQKLSPMIVTIDTVGGTQPPAQAGGAPGAADNPHAIGATGSGFIVADGPTTGLIYDADGLIITSAFNFVRQPSLITVTLHDGRRFVGELLAKDEVRRLAMLKIDATDLPVPAWVEDENEIRVGQTVLAMGRGFRTVEPALSAGIISGKNRQAGLAIQTDAKLSPGNFGGPLVDIEGRVLGLCIPMGMGTGAMAGVEWYDSGIGFAIPHQQLASAAEDLARGHSLRRGYLGVQINRRLTRVVRVSQVAEPSPAQRAGMKPGDYIKAVDDQPVTNYPSLRKLLITRLAGERVKVTVERGDEKLELRLILAVPEDLGKFSKTPDDETDGSDPDSADPGSDDPADDPSEPGDEDILPTPDPTE